MPVPARQNRRVDRTRTKLLDAAQALFVERGYDSTLLGEVTQRADLGTGTLYLHFRDKRALYEAV
ncbi:MAG: helix-turn-helix domain-containing protein, partial [Usitatibacter sp.]